MDRDVFAARFMGSAQRARDFARGFVVEVLPEAVRFRVLFNQSNDDIEPLRAGEIVFPQDSGRTLSACTAENAVDQLWRNGRIPEWIDLSVVDVKRASTVVEALCCGRFTDDEALLYHRAEGAPPFHVTSPALLPGYDGSPFSLHWMRRR
jgi:hypothetical protein